MTKRTCPWCGGENLVLVSCQGMDPKNHHASYHYWEDRECGYRERTSSDEYYDYEKKEFVQREREVYSFHKPRSPLPLHQQPEYLRTGILKPETPEGQQTFNQGDE